jgi:aspartyl-tRNA(Asn)/glutamyl-tRNA(Gln) amidotransferase subunit C
MKINVPHVAKLANLTLTQSEITTFEKQLSDVLEYVKKLEEANTDNVAETSQVTGLENVTREDTSDASLQQADALASAKAVKNGLFQVKGIFKEEA